MRRLTWLSLLLLVLDQATKTLPQVLLRGGEPLLVDGFGLTYVTSPGVWIWPTIPPALVAVMHALVVAVWVAAVGGWRWYRRWYRDSSRWIVLSPRSPSAPSAGDSVVGAPADSMGGSAHPRVRITHPRGYQRPFHRDRLALSTSFGSRLGGTATLDGAVRRPDVRWLLAAFLLGHAAVHAVMWALPFTPAVAEMPFDPSHSWLFGEIRVPAVALAGLATVAFAVGAVGYLASAGWWPAALLAGAAASLLLMLLTFTPWWSVGILLSAGLAVYAWQA